MAEPAIRVHQLTKEFKIRKRQSGALGPFKTLIRPRYTSVEAVRQVSYTIEPGERIAFIGPNGAGKSTTIKMMAGILHPSAGEMQVLGLTPWKDRQELGFKMGTVFGQKSQLWYHLPARETFELLAKIYEIPNRQFKNRLGDLVDRFEIGSIMDQTVRQLSLGQRMRCELVASLLHRPKILFLDEPTIGLDVSAKAVIRDLIKELSDLDGTTLFLTSHDTGDMERVSDRVMVINHGELLIDSSLGSLRKKYIQQKVITFVTKSEDFDLSLPGVQKIHSEPHRNQYEVSIKESPVEVVIAEALKISPLRDITVEDPPMEKIVQDIYVQTQ